MLAALPPGWLPTRSRWRCEFGSVDPQNNALRAEAATERRSLLAHPDAEPAELVDSLVELGLTRPTSEVVAAEVHRDPELALRVHPTRELGVDPEERPSPWVAAISSFLCFAVGGFVPLVPILLGSSLLLARLVGAAGLFVAGALVSPATARRWWVNGLRQLTFGAAAAGATYGVGSLIGVSIS